MCTNEKSSIAKGQVENIHFNPQWAPVVYIALVLQAPPSQLMEVSFFVNTTEPKEERQRDMVEHVRLLVTGKTYHLIISKHASPKTTKAGMAACLLCKEGLWNRKNLPILEGGYSPKCR